MQICLLKQIKQTVTAKNTDTVGKGYPIRQSDRYCVKYDWFYEEYLLKQIKETITAKNTDTVGQGYPLKQSNSYCEEYDCLRAGLTVTTNIKCVYPKIDVAPNTANTKGGFRSQR